MFFLLPICRVLYFGYRYFRPIAIYFFQVIYPSGLLDSTAMLRCLPQAHLLPSEIMKWNVRGPAKRPALGGFGCLGFAFWVTCQRLFCWLWFHIPNQRFDYGSLNSKFCWWLDPVLIHFESERISHLSYLRQFFKAGAWPVPIQLSESLFWLVLSLAFWRFWESQLP